MSVDVTNETQWVIDPKVFSDLGILGTRPDAREHPVRPDHHVRGSDPIAELHMRWMNLEGPTDVMSFPMDELRPGDGKTVMEGVLGDIVICPWVAAQQAAAAGHSTMQEMLLLTIHGILHLLGYDHVTPEQERQMFGLQRQLLLTFFALRHDANVQATLPAGTPDALALYDAAHGAGRDLDPNKLPNQSHQIRIFEPSRTFDTNHYGVFQYHADRHHRHSCTRGGPVRLALADHGRR